MFLPASSIVDRKLHNRTDFIPRTSLLVCCYGSKHTQTYECVGVFPILYIAKHTLSHTKHALKCITQIGKGSLRKFTVYILPLLDVKDVQVYVKVKLAMNMIHSFNTLLS